MLVQRGPPKPWYLLSPNSTNRLRWWAPAADPLQCSHCAHMTCRLRLRGAGCATADTPYWVCLALISCSRVTHRDMFMLLILTWAAFTIPYR